MSQDSTPQEPVDQSVEEDLDTVGEEFETADAADPEVTSDADALRQANTPDQLAEELFGSLGPESTDDDGGQGPENAEGDEAVEAVQGDAVAADSDEADAQDDEESQESEDGEPAEEVDPVEALRKELRFLEGDWYVIHSYAGYENRVKQNLEQRAQSLNLEDYIFQAEVPMEQVTEIKNGQRKSVRRVRIPGYVLVRMDLTDESWGAVRHTPGVKTLDRKSVV